MSCQLLLCLLSQTKTKDSLELSLNIVFSNETMKAIWNDVVIAESDDTVVVEGNHYFPSDSIKQEYFKKTDLTTFCGWKGMANYYSVTVNGKTNKDCAWYYAEPNDAAKKIKGMVAFWNGVKVK